MSVNASSDKEYISIITLFWSLGNYTLYWYESDTFFFFLVVIISPHLEEECLHLFLPIYMTPFPPHS